MKYTSDIYELPLSVFIEIYTNEKNNIEFQDDDKPSACSKVISDYIEIVGGKGLISEIMKANERITLTGMVECMAACENLLKLKMNKEVCEILLSLGYSCKVNDTDSMRSRVKSLLARARYDLDKLNNESASETKKKGDRPDKKSFINEVVAIGKYNKMHINTHEWTAGAYACLVRQTCAEIDELNRKHK